MIEAMVLMTQEEARSIGIWKEEWKDINHKTFLVEEETLWSSPDMKFYSLSNHISQLLVPEIYLVF